jgi:Putative peptidoglycan binding domain
MIGIELDRSAPAATQSNRGRAHWLSGLLAATCLSLFASSVVAVHPYDRWATELGIDQDVSYDGTRVMEFQDGTFEMTERRAPGKMYTEMYLGNMTTGVILREDLGKSYVLMPSMGFYREESLEDGLMQASNGLEFSQIEKLGKEDVNGHSSTKYKTRFKDKEGKGAGFIWVTDTGVPIKIDMIYSNQEAKGQRLTMQFAELNLRKQDPAYFEVPANLKPMTISSGFSNLGQMMGMGAESPAADSSASAPASSSDSAAGGADTIQSVTKSVSEGTKGLMKSMGIGGLFGMSDDEPEEAAQDKATSSSSGNLTQTVQIHLKALGYDPGKIDGEASVQTSIAISQFQAEKGLEVTGEVTPQLAGILEAEVEK